MYITFSGNSIYALIIQNISFQLFNNKFGHRKTQSGRIIAP